VARGRSAEAEHEDPHEGLCLSTEVARKRQTGPAALAKQMHGELDSIALKALEKDRPRRYGSPSDLAADIRRYLNNEVVLSSTSFQSPARNRTPLACLLPGGTMTPKA